jgi:hypothetical protein
MTTEAESRSPEPQELFRLAIDYGVREINVALPGQIDSYDAGEQKADVKPLVKRLLADEDGEEIVEELPIIPGVPVVFPRGGGFFISMPVKKDDFCLLVFNSFPIDKYKAGTGQDTNPEEFDMHQLSDAVALMGFAPFSKSIADADADNVVIGKEEGTQVHIADDKIELGEKDASEQVSVDSKLQTELSNIGTELGKINTALGTNDTHTHNVTAVGSPTGPPIPLMAASISYSPGATNSTLVTLKE